MQESLNIDCADNWLVDKRLFNQKNFDYQNKEYMVHAHRAINLLLMDDVKYLGLSLVSVGIKKCQIIIAPQSLYK